MSQKLKPLAVISLIATLMITSVGVATADQPTLDWGAEVDPAQCPTGELVINVTHKVTNDVDSAVGGGVWATDDYNRHIQVLQVAPGTFCAVVQYHGAFVTDDGPSPARTDLDGIAAGIEGTFQGGYRTTIFTGVLNPSPAYPTSGNIGVFDYGCDVEADPGDHSSCMGLFSWPGTYFTTISGFDLAWWGWIYHAGSNSTWVNAITGNQGDITD